jgi:hypothetical protein
MNNQIPLRKIAKNTAGYGGAVARAVNQKFSVAKESMDFKPLPVVQKSKITPSGNVDVTDRAIIIEVENLGVPKVNGASDAVGSAGWLAAPEYTPQRDTVALFDGLFSDWVTNHINQYNTDLAAVDQVYLNCDNGSIAALSVTDIKNKLRYIPANPAKVERITATFDKTLQKSEVLNLRAYTPWQEDNSSRNIRFQDYKNPEHYDQEVIYLKDPKDKFVIDQNLRVKLGLAAGVKMTLTIYFGDYVNLGNALAQA